MELVLVQTFDEPISGYWDGGRKQRFEWSIDHNRVGHDSKGAFIRIGSWSANHFFNVALGKTDKQTLANARRRLLACAKRSNQKCTFEYLAR